MTIMGRIIRLTTFALWLMPFFGTTIHAQETPVPKSESQASLLLYIGTSGPKAQGIFCSRFDPVSGSLTSPKLASKVSGASFLAIHPSYKFLYSVGQAEDATGTKFGALLAYSIDPQSGKLEALNHQPSGGKGPCFVGLDRHGANAFVANYGDGVVSVVPIAKDGRLAVPSARIQHEGKGPDEKRQDGPHAHSFFVDPTDHFALAPDLGLDKVLIYKLEPATGTLSPNDPPAGIVPPGGGPRHLSFHPNGKFVYVNNEMGDSVTAFTWDAQRGAMQEIQTIGSLPDDYTKREANTTAEILIHASGKFLYTSNRGHDSIAVFSIDSSSGKLTAVGHTPTNGKTPRNFGLDPTGKWLLAANQTSHNVVVFAIDQSTGALVKTDHEIEVGSPTCVRFVRND